jgi:mannose-6-phosphate isomerase-like protein (cupin superfamily)
MFREAAQYGDLVVILNSDEWLLRKKGFIFLPWDQRAAIIGDLSYVSQVVAVDDSDGSVCEALRRIKPKYFANGGDRKQDNTPELAVCMELGIEMLWNIGGGKENSSSDVAKRAWVERLWGRYLTLDEGEDYKVKKLVLDPHKSISLQYHNHRGEYWYVVESTAQVRLGDKVFSVSPGSPPVIVEPKMTHQLANAGNTPLVVIEVQSGSYLGEDDIFRITPA